MNKILDDCREFFDLEDKEEKREYEGKKILDTICYGTSTDGPPSEALFWRDYLRVRVHPEFHSPRKPAGFSEVLAAFSEGVRGVVRDLLGGISESLGLESSHIYRALDVESSLQLFVANFYPPCPQPELALGLPSHTDLGLLTLLMQNGINGLQLQRKGKWINANIISGAFFVQIGDHVEHGVKYYVNLDRIEVTEDANDLNQAKGTNNPNRGGGVAIIKAPTPRNRKNPQIGDSPDYGGWSHDPSHHHQLWSLAPFRLIRIAGAFCDLDSVEINEKFDVVLKSLSNRKFVHF
ncbi:hypothetical protein CDL15_Pgr010854 [Punica granatum]|uniref:Fe2OG dioxygenase domain-containing protein n=1 Tax=Punica granatum TaxID=22663 RepID=A0A218W5J5_PUNGR|nr:hypothetical protein CDL15_Pgr010854 [Punica granatum]